jgi:transcriptional regulator with XRE-family HTH domain
MMILFPLPTPNDAPDGSDELGLVFGRNVKRIRIDQGINKKSFALICGISRQLLDKIESGTADVRLSYVQRIADALSVKPVVLLVSQAPGPKPPA